MSHPYNLVSVVPVHDDFSGLYKVLSYLLVLISRCCFWEYCVEKNGEAGAPWKSYRGAAKGGALCVASLSDSHQDVQGTCLAKCCCPGKPLE